MNQISINISTTSSVINWSLSPPNLPPAQLPKINVNGLAIPAGNPAMSPTGFQLVVFDINQTIPTPASILVNTTLVVNNSGQNNSWWNVYDYLYQHMVRALLINGDPDDQLIVLASYGLDANMAPDNDSLQLLVKNGAGPQLQHWMKTCDIGSQVGNPTSWVSFPSNYVLVAFGGSGYGNGNEIFQQPQGNNTSVTTTLNVNLDLGTRELKAA